MPFLPQFEYEVFLSYGWGDSSDPTKGDRAWVAKFKEVLEQEISDNLPHKARVYLDIEHSQNGKVPDNLERALRSSVLFLAVLTPNSVREESWCKWEFEQFLAHSLDPLNPQDTRQIFSILIRDVPRSQWPSGLNPYKFMYDVDGRLLQHGPDLLDDASSPPGILVRKIAVDIKKQLEEIQEQIKNTFLIAETSVQLKAKAKTLIREAKFEQKVALGVAGIFNRPEPEGGLELEHRLRWSSRSIHLVDEEFYLQIPGRPAPVQSRQLEAAQVRFRAGGQAIMIWKSPAAAQPDFDALAKIAPDAVIQENRTIHETQPFLVAPAGAAEQPPAGGVRYVYVECKEKDRGIVRELRSYLPQGVLLRPPLFDGPKPGRMRMNKNLTERCHGVAVYFGDRNEYDTLVACENATSALGERMPMVPRVVLLHPAEGNRLDFVHPDFQIIHWLTQGPSAAELSEFWARVLAAPLA